MEEGMSAEPILKWPGAKWRLSSWLHRFTPRGMLRVVDVYCGSAAFALTLVERPRHLVINDQDRYVNLLFRALRERREDLITAVTFTPWSRAEYLEVTGPAGRILETGDLVEDARRFLIASWQAHGTTVCTRNGWRHRGVGRVGRQLSDTYSQWQQLPARLALAAECLLDAEIECLPALTIIGRYATPETLLYCDPPYVRQTSEGYRKRLYRHEMTDDDHVALLDALQAHPGPVMLSGYHNAIYDDRLRDAHWRCAETRTQAEKGNTRLECLWLNPDCVARMGYGPLFEEQQR
jgi:DNA adenine methylase